MDSRIAMVMDLGGTRIKLGIVQKDTLCSVANIDSRSKNGLRERLPEIKAVMDDLLLRCRITPAEVAGIGIAVPGIVDSKQKKILSIDNKFNDAPGIDFSAWACESWGIPLAMENDARSALIGEWRYGKGRGFENVVLMTIGTGVGSSALIEGKILRGKHFQAGCLGGHFTVNVWGQKCNCGNYGCVEAEASTWNIERIAHSYEQYNTSALQGEAKIDFETVFRCASSGDTLAVELRDHCLNVWSAAAINLIHAYDPEILIIGGGVMASAGTILPYIESRIAERAWTPWGKVKVSVAENINTAALLGIASLVFHQ